MEEGRKLLLSGYFLSLWDVVLLCRGVEVSIELEPCALERCKCSYAVVNKYLEYVLNKFVVRKAMHCVRCASQ